MYYTYTHSSTANTGILEVKLPCEVTLRSQLYKNVFFFFFNFNDWNKNDLNPQLLEEPFVLVAVVPLFELVLAFSWALGFRAGPLKMSLLKTALSKRIFTEYLVGMM